MLFTYPIANAVDTDAPFYNDWYDTMILDVLSENKWTYPCGFLPLSVRSLCAEFVNYTIYPLFSLFLIPQQRSMLLYLLRFIVVCE